MNSLKYKISAIGVVVVLVGAFAFLATQNKSESPATNQTASSTTQQTPATSSILPADTSLLIAEHSIVLGEETAPVTIVEFLDPECEACGAMNPIVKKIIKEFDGQIRLVVRYMPYHQNSVYVASLLEAAREQGQYWPALDLVFKEQGAWASHHDPKPELVLPLLKTLGLDIQKIKKQVDAQKYLSLIEKDKQDGELLGVRATPTFFINGEMQYEIGYEPLKNAITKKLESLK